MQQPSLFLQSLENDLHDDFQFETTLRLLPFADQVNVMRMKFERDAVKVLGSALLQRAVLKLVVEGQDLEIRYGPSGKPILAGQANEDQNVHFNMSNEKELNGMIVAAVEVGLDLSMSRQEKVDQFKEILHPSEYHYFVSHESEFHWCWALKEAYGKYIGAGINYDLKTVRASWPLRKCEWNEDENGVDTSGTEKFDVFQKKNVKWYTSELFVNDTLRELGLWFCEIDGAVMCVVGCGKPVVYGVSVKNCTALIK